MFGSPSTQRTAEQNQNQANAMPVTVGQSYPIQLDPQTAAVAAAAAAAATVNVQDNQLARLAPTDGSHGAISVPAGNEQQMVEQSKAEEASLKPKKGNRGRKRKNET